MAKTPHVTAEMTSASSARLIIRDAYDVREDLKARGYKFDQATLGWIMSFASQKEVASEMLRTMDAGYIVAVAGRSGSPDRALVAKLAA